MSRHAMRFRLPGGRRAALEVVAQIDGDYEVTIKPYKASRSLEQNSLYWVWLGELAQWLDETHGKRFSDEDLHEFFRGKFLTTDIKPGPDGTPVRCKKSTTQLKVDEFSEYLERIAHYAADELGCILSNPYSW